MKKWMTAALLVLFAATAFAQKNQGTVFEKGTLKELLALADEQDKYLFVDVYATWCGPCQIMAKQIFPQQKVGEFFNKTFVNAKFDAEKGEGVDVAKRYSVKAYPTFLILDSDGSRTDRRRSRCRPLHRGSTEGTREHRTVNFGFS